MARLTLRARPNLSHSLRFDYFTALYQRHLTGKTDHNQGWWLTFTIAWVATICWMLVQIVHQD